MSTLFADISRRDAYLSRAGRGWGTLMPQSRRCGLKGYGRFWNCSPEFCRLCGLVQEALFSMTMSILILVLILLMISLELLLILLASPVLFLLFLQFVGDIVVEPARVHM